MYYRIKLINTKTGDTGVSTTVYSSRQAAKRAAVRMFANIPGFVYEIVTII